MTDREPTPAGAVLVAIDISKLRNDVLIEVPGTVRRSKASASPDNPLSQKQRASPATRAVTGF